MFMEWLKAAGIRALKTFAQTMAGMLTGDMVGIMDVDWIKVLSVAALSCLYSFLTSLAGLPELNNKPPEHAE